MFQTVLDFLTLLAASLLTLIFNHFKISIAFYQQIIIVLLLLMLGLYNFFTIRKLKRIFVVQPILFITSLFVQLVVISTGGFLSPFLVLIHLYTLTTSFLLKIATALSFLFFTVSILAVNTFIDPNQLNTIKTDPGSYILFGLSFLVIVPISLLISKKYHLKEELSKILSKQVKVGEVILESLTELVLVTDQALKIVFINEALEKTLKLTKQQVLGKSFFEILDLKDEQGQPVSPVSLPIDKVLEDKTTRIVSGLYLYTQGRAAPYVVTIQIHPILDSQGKIEQISFVITEGKGISYQSKKHLSLIKALENKNLRLESLKKQLQSLKLFNQAAQLELIEKAEADLRLVQEVEDHPIKEDSNLVDVAALIHDIILKRGVFAKILGVDLKFMLDPEDLSEVSLINLKSSDIDPKSLSLSDFAVPADIKWLIILLEKVLDLSILLASSIKNSKVEIMFDRKDKDFIKVYILTDTPKLTKLQIDKLLTKYYDNLLESTNLKFGSGLEGFIVKTLSTQLNIPVSLDVLKDPDYKLRISISLSRKARGDVVF